eukprot:scaffold59346_cov38-Phaeocystis_antarctica.AAC.1
MEVQVGARQTYRRHPLRVRATAGPLTLARARLRLGLYPWEPGSLVLLAAAPGYRAKAPQVRSLIRETAATQTRRRLTAARSLLGRGNNASAISNASGSGTRGDNQ